MYPCWTTRTAHLQLCWSSAILSEHAGAGGFLVWACHTAWSKDSEHCSRPLDFTSRQEFCLKWWNHGESWWGSGSLTQIMTISHCISSKPSTILFSFKSSIQERFSCPCLWLLYWVPNGYNWPKAIGHVCVVYVSQVCNIFDITSFIAQFQVCTQIQPFYLKGSNFALKVC